MIECIRVSPRPWRTSPAPMLATPYGARSHPEATPGCREGVQRRSVTTTGHGSLHPVRALLGQPRARSEGPLGAVRTVPEILIISDMIRKGKGLKVSKKVYILYGALSLRLVRFSHGLRAVTLTKSTVVSDAKVTITLFCELWALTNSVAGAHRFPCIVCTCGGFLPSDFERFNGCTGPP